MTAASPLAAQDEGLAMASVLAGARAADLGLVEWAQHWSGAQGWALQTALATPDTRTLVGPGFTF